MMPTQKKSSAGATNVQVSKPAAKPGKNGAKAASTGERANGNGAHGAATAVAVQAAPPTTAAASTVAKRALVLCEGNFANPNGKTAHGLVRYSSVYDVVGVLDSTLAGRDSGASAGGASSATTSVVDAAEFLDGTPKGIPILADVDAAIDARKPTHLVLGVATDGGKIPAEYRPIIKRAMARGLHVVAGLHEKLNQDAEFVALARAHGVTLEDVRIAPTREESRFFTGKIEEVTCPVIAVLGTDSAIGKRTTARVLVNALNEAGYKAVFIGTGQTGRLQGAKYSIILDSIINDFVTGEIEHAVWSAWKNESPDIIVVEGQGSITHPAYPGGFEIIAGARVKGVVLQHAPGRKTLDGFPQYPMPTLEREIGIIELLSQHRVFAITVNHENLTEADRSAWVRETEVKWQRTVTDVLKDGADSLVQATVKEFGLRPRA